MFVALLVCSLLSLARRSASLVSLGPPASSCGLLATIGRWGYNGIGLWANGARNVRENIQTRDGPQIACEGA
jgi:hypothetical protein